MKNRVHSVCRVGGRLKELNCDRGARGPKPNERVYIVVVSVKFRAPPRIMQCVLLVSRTPWRPAEQQVAHSIYHIHIAHCHPESRHPQVFAMYATRNTLVAYHNTSLSTSENTTAGNGFTVYAAPEFPRPTAAAAVTATLHCSNPPSQSPKYCGSPITSVSRNARVVGGLEQFCRAVGPLWRSTRCCAARSGCNYWEHGMVFTGKKSTTESVTSSRLHSARNGMLLLCAARRARVATIIGSVPDDPERE